MAIKVYIIETPEQLRELYTLRPEGNQTMENLAKVWRAQRVLNSANHRNPPLPPMARVAFDGKARSAMVYKTIGNKGDIGQLPYNRALAYCREYLKLEG